jgi:orotidine-5'-phosphate decarboxylase
MKANSAHPSNKPVVRKDAKMTRKRTCEAMIVALDVMDTTASRRLTQQLCGIAGAFKVGLELFNASGPAVFDAIREAGGERIFYDAKLHDIPNTVRGAARAAARHNLWLLNVHALGGPAMMRAAREGAAEGAAAAGCTPPLLLAVTLLTSLDDRTLREETGLSGTVMDEVVRLAALAREAGMDGVVASPREVAAIRSACGSEFLIVTPGIRAAVPAGTLDVGTAPRTTVIVNDDQRRPMTPGDAIRAGSDYLVIGRPILAAADPRKAAEALADEILVARSERT